eukprot:1420471-Amphidinium_carterae.1
MRRTCGYGGLAVEHSEVRLDRAAYSRLGITVLLVAVPIECRTESWTNWWCGCDRRCTAGRCWGSPHEV